MNPITAFLVVVCVIAGLAIGRSMNNILLALPFFGAAVIIAFSLKMANAWQKFVILRMGKLQSVKGAGLLVIIPVIDALQLRAMNIIYEATKERGATILIPSSMVDSLNPSVTSLALSLATKEMPDTETFQKAVT
jgi:regulator of protease activity HflC (stomatin/prohibitin superfamily)